MNLASAGEFFGDLEPCVSSANDEHRPLGNSAGVPIVGAVHLDHRGIEVPGELGDSRHLEGAGRHYHLTGLDHPAVEFEHEARTVACQAAHLVAEFDWKLEGLRVPL